MTGGQKFDTGKARVELLPPRPLIEIAEVLTFGAEKYAAWNWSKGIAASRLFAAMLRHLWAWWAGEDNDPETGKSHLAHAGCCLLFLADQRHRLPEQDDRPIGLCATASPPRTDAPPQDATPAESPTRQPGRRVPRYRAVCAETDGDCA